MGTSQLLSVPYAMYAETSGSSTPGPQGEQGEQGIQGETGAPGADGTNGTDGDDGISIVWKGTLANAPASPVTNWGYYNSTDKQSYIYDGDSWETLAKDGESGSGGTHYLGEELDGGIIFYIYIDSNGEQHGLIVSKTEEENTKWQNTGATTNADRTEDGLYNTGLMTDSPAKTWATGLGADWYLPSIDELSLLWHNRYYVNKTSRANGYTLLSTTDRYWSSTEYSSTTALIFYFINGYVNNGHKTSTYSVRAVRAFGYPRKVGNLHNFNMFSNY